MAAARFPMMEYLVDRQSDAYLREIAPDTLRRKTCPTLNQLHQLRATKCSELGRRLVFDGDETPTHPIMSQLPRDEARRCVACGPGIARACRRTT